MKAFDEFKKHLELVRETQEPLLKDKETLERQLGYFQLEREAHEAIGDTEAMLKADKAVEVLSRKLAGVNRRLADLDTERPALEVFKEGEGKIMELKIEAANQWNKCKQVREAYLAELQKLKDLRRESFNIKAATREASPHCRKEPVDGVEYFNFSDLEVSLKMLRGYLA